MRTGRPGQTSDQYVITLALKTGDLVDVVVAATHELEACRKATAQGFYRGMPIQSVVTARRRR